MNHQLEKMLSVLDRDKSQEINATKTAPETTGNRVSETLKSHHVVL